MSTLADTLAAAPADLATLLTALADASAELAGALRTAGRDGRLGRAGTTNVQGEQQKALDVLADEIFFERVRQTGLVRAVISEEQEQPVVLTPGAPFLVAFDPLDGSSNADVNMTIGSIFSVHRLDGEEAYLLYPGRRQIAAGFAAYGPATTLVITTGQATSLFELDGTSGRFELLEPALQIPTESAEYAINTSRARHWDPAVAAYIADRVAGKAGPLGRDYNMRWTGSMVADVLRVLRRGGTFLYPADAETAARGGRLRLLYEAAPIAMIIEAAGGKATTGPLDLLDVEPTSIHQRIAVVLGSSDEVEALRKTYEMTT